MVEMDKTSSPFKGMIPPVPFEITRHHSREKNVSASQKLYKHVIFGRRNVPLNISS